MAVQEKILADGWMEVQLTDATGKLEAILELSPTHHAVYVSHLLAAQAEVAAAESVPRTAPRVLEFPLDRVRATA